jgi:hypothetical protein
MHKMMPNCGDYFVMHSWREGNILDDHCIVVWEWNGKISVHFFANWVPMNGYFAGIDFPMDHEIWIGVRPNHQLGSREYTSFTWWVWDKTTDEYREETRNTPETWISKSMDVTLEMVDQNTPNGLKRSMSELICLDQNNNDVYLPDVFGWCEWPHPTITNHREEIYTENGYEAECIQWKTCGEEEMVLNINSDPTGQEVLIDNEVVGTTPLSETVICADHNIMVQSQGTTEYPDLIIEDVWNVGNVIKYRITNIGDCAAGPSHTKLKVDGVEKETIAEEGLSAGHSREGSFMHFWECSGTEDTIEVITDCYGEVSEGSESNNSLQKILTCNGGCIGIDLTPIDIFDQYGYIAFVIKNNGSLPSSTCYHYIYTKSRGEWVYQGRKIAGAQAPNTTVSLQSSVYWPRAGTQIKIRTNGDNAFIDCNSENDEMEVTS